MADNTLPLPANPNSAKTSAETMAKQNEQNIVNLGNGGMNNLSEEMTLKKKGYVLVKILGEGAYAKVNKIHLNCEY